MVRETDAASYRRRTLLRAAGVAATAGGVGLLADRGGAQDDARTEGEETFALQQGSGCVPITPLSGERPVEEFYEYAYPTSRFEGPPGVDGHTYSSEGTVDLQREQTSIVFLYDGPEGLSLVFVHGKHDEEEAQVPAGESEAGGTVSLEIRGLPSEGGWVVLDDYYAVDGEQAPSNFDRWTVTEEGYRFHWAYRGGRTDGGAFRGLEADPSLDVEVYPWFNDRAGLADDHDYGTITAWEALSGDREDPDRQPLTGGMPIRITSGSCADATSDRE